MENLSLIDWSGKKRHFMAAGRSSEN